MSPVPAADAAEIVELLARYAHVVDNRDWSQATTVFRADVQLGRSPVISSGLANLTALVGSAPATHGHNTTDVILDARPDGTVRAWSKFYIVRGDGTVGSGDYQDTLVKTDGGWRIAERDVSRGNRLENDPTGGASTRTFSLVSWLDEPQAG
jgi:3-phenylpropionate/cinnamic acid dioxygenase small subunit